jgi:pyridoxamine 5'-phosphate oxidase
LTDISELRSEYARSALRRTDLADDPVCQFERWFGEARDAGVAESNAMALATVGADAQPSVRTVLMKYFDASGFVFFTNLESVKADQIAANPRVALLFYWQPLERQVRIRGGAEKIKTSEALRYFMKRPRGSQLGAWVSDQSSVINSRTLLEAKLDEMKRRFGKGEIPLPSFWGGYRVRPDQIEFWQGRTNRLHDRFLYSRQASGWQVERLAP